MLHYVYYPYPASQAGGANAATLRRYTDKYTQGANNNNDEKATDHRDGQVLFYKPEPMPTNPADGPLDRVEPDDLLLIASHGGDRDATSISSDKGSRLTHNDLAVQLRDAGLKPGHVLVKMLSCYAAGILEGTVESPVRKPTKGDDFFAKLLAQSLYGLGYHQIVVGGYPGPVNTGAAAARRTPTRQQNVTVGLVGAGAIDAHGQIVWVDGQGREVSRNAVTQLKLQSKMRQGSMIKNWRGDTYKRQR